MARQIYAVMAAVVVLYVSTGCHKNIVLPPPGNQTPANAAGVQANGPILFNGPTFPPPQTGASGDFYIDVSSGTLYGPKSPLGWGLGMSLPGYGPEVQLYSGTVNPSAYTAFPGDYYLNLSNDELFGPKVGYVWGPGMSLKAGSASDTTVDVK